MKVPINKRLTASHHWLGSNFGAGKTSWW